MATEIKSLEIVWSITREKLIILFKDHFLFIKV